MELQQTAISINSRLKTLSTPLQDIIIPVADGRPLYLYRISYSQFEELQRYLTEYNTLVGELMNTKRYAQELDKVFVLYASEWWRRKYNGNWGWSDLLSSIAISHDDIDGQTLLLFTENGLKKWQRDISRTDNNHRSALGSFLREGGLPVHYFNTSGGWLDLLRGALAERARYDNVRQFFERNSYRLPKTAGQKVILDTLEALVNDIHHLVTDNDLDTQTDPIAYLDNKMTNWQNQFPFSLEDDTARNFLTRLIVDSVNTIKHRSSKEADIDNWYNAIQLQRFLIIPLIKNEQGNSNNNETSKGIKLIANIVPPNVLHLGEDNMQAITDDDISLVFYQQGNETPLAQWQAYPVYNQNRLKTINPKTISLPPEQWSDDISLHISDSLGKTIKELKDKQDNTINPYQNASMYEVSSDTPFLASIERAESTYIRAQYQGGYNQSVQDEEAIIFVPTGWQTHHENNSQMIDVGSIETEALNGKLYRLIGTAVVSKGGEKHKFKTSSMDASYYYEISGRKLADFVYPSLVIKGDFNVVKVDKKDSNKKDRVPNHSIWLSVVNEDGTISPYRSLAQLKGTPVGCYRLQVRDDSGNTLFKTTIGLVPKDFRYRLKIHTSVAGHARGIIDVETNHAIDLLGYSPASLHCTERTTKNSFQMMIDKVPNEKVTLSLSFLDTAPRQSTAIATTKALRFRCYFPSMQTVIYDDNGNEYNSTSLHLNINNDLLGYHVKVFNPNKHRTLKVYFALKSEPSIYILKTYTVDANKFLALRPVTWRPIIQRLLSLSSKGLDDMIKVSLIMDASPQFEISFGYYNYTLSVDKPNERVLLKTINNKVDKAAINLCDNMLLKALNFSNPDHPPIELNPIEFYKAMTSIDDVSDTDTRSSSSEIETDDDVLCGWHTDKLLVAESGTYLIFIESVDTNEDAMSQVEGVIVTSTATNTAMQGSMVDVTYRSQADNSDLIDKSIRSTIYHVNDSDDNCNDEPNTISSNDVVDNAVDTFIPENNSDTQVYPASDDIASIEGGDSIGNSDEDTEEQITQGKSDIAMTLAEASGIANTNRRTEAMRAIYRQMAFDVTHPDWAYLKTITTTCLHLPLITFDNWLAARQVPEFMCAVVVYGKFILGEDVVQKVKDELGFVWEIIAFDDFKKCWEQFERYADNSLKVITNDNLRQSSLKIMLNQRKKELVELSSVFDCWLGALQPYGSNYNLSMMAYLLKSSFNSLIAQKQQLEASWSIHEDMEDIISEILRQIPSECQITLNIPKKHMQTVAMLPIAMAWMSAQTSHTILYQYGRDDDRFSDIGELNTDGLTVAQLNKLKNLRKKLRSHSVAIYEIKQFAPVWYYETFSLAFGWFNYCIQYK